MIAQGLVTLAGSQLGEAGLLSHNRHRVESNAAYTKQEKQQPLTVEAPALRPVPAVILNSSGRLIPFRSYRLMMLVKRVGSTAHKLSHKGLAP